MIESAATRNWFAVPRTERSKLADRQAKIGGARGIGDSVGAFSGDLQLVAVARWAPVGSMHPHVAKIDFAQQEMPAVLEPALRCSSYRAVSTAT